MVNSRDNYTWEEPYDWMDQKTLAILEFQKILERLSGYTGFNASADKARRLQPTADIR